MSFASPVNRRNSARARSSSTKRVTRSNKPVIITARNSSSRSSSTPRAKAPSNAHFIDSEDEDDDQEFKRLNININDESSNNSRKKSKKNQAPTSPHRIRKVACFCCSGNYRATSLPFHLQWCLLKRQNALAYLPEHMRPKSPEPPTLPLPADDAPLAEVTPQLS